MIHPSGGSLWNLMPCDENQYVFQGISNWQNLQVVASSRSEEDRKWCHIASGPTVCSGCFLMPAVGFKLSVPKSKHPQQSTGSHLVWNASKYPSDRHPHQSDAIIHHYECRVGGFSSAKWLLLFSVEKWLDGFDFPVAHEWWVWTKNKALGTVLLIF